MKQYSFLQETFDYDPSTTGMRLSKLVTGTGKVFSNAAKGMKNVITQSAVTKRQLVDADIAKQKQILKDPKSTEYERAVAKAKIRRDKAIIQNLYDYRDAVAQTPDKYDRRELRLAYKDAARHIKDTYSADRQTI